MLFLWILDNKNGITYHSEQSQSVAAAATRMHAVSILILLYWYWWWSCSHARSKQWFIIHIPGTRSTKATMP